jgi:hypothetical protein
MRLGYQTLQPRRMHTFAPLVLLGITLTVVMRGLLASMMPAFKEVAPNPAYSAAFSKLVERVRVEPREVLAEPFDVVVLAGRRTLFEPTIFGILHRQGLWDPGPLVTDICGGKIGLLVLGEQLDSSLSERRRYPHWPEPILAALQQTVVFESAEAGRFIYTPGEPANAALSTEPGCNRRPPGEG